jgi:hypothetical protein
VIDFEQRAAYAAIVQHEAPIIGRVGHRVTQPGDVVRARRFWEHCAAVWTGLRFREFAVSGHVRAIPREQRRWRVA